MNLFIFVSGSESKERIITNSFGNIFKYDIKEKEKKII